MNNNLVDSRQVIENIVSVPKKEVVQLTITNEGVRCLTTFLAEQSRDIIKSVVGAFLEDDVHALPVR